LVRTVSVLAKTETWIQTEDITATPHYTVLSFFFQCVRAGLLCQPQVIVKMIVEKQMECRLAGETEVVGENLPQRHFCPSQNATWPDPKFEPGPPRWEAGD
jgi:hypothetical protein